MMMMNTESPCASPVSPYVQAIQM